MNFRKLKFFYFMFFALVLLIAKQNRCFSKEINDNVEKTFVCPPCGCSGDKIYYTERGKCTECSMDLVILKPGFKKKTHEIISPIFQNGKLYAQLYIRIVYPLMLFTLLMSILLFLKSSRNLRQKLFSLFVFSIALYILKFQLYGSYYSVFTSKIGLFIPLSFLLVIWPCLYLIIKYGFDRNKLNLKNQYLHFIPGALSSFFQLLMLFSFPLSEVLIYNHFDTYLVVIEQLLFIAGGVIYFKLIFNECSQNNFSNLPIRSRKTILILISFLVGFSFLLVFHFSLNLIFYQGKITALDYHFLWFFVALFTPWFCYLIWKFDDHFLILKIPNFRLSEEAILKLKEKFNDILRKDKIYENTKLSLDQTSNLLQLSVREMSEFIKRGYNCNFYVLINSYRVKAAKEKLLSEEYSHLTNDAIGNSCGFGSKTTFINSFKKETGMTPKQFQQRNKNTV